MEFYFLYKYYLLFWCLLQIIIIYIFNILLDIKNDMFKNDIWVNSLYSYISFRILISLFDILYNQYIINIIILKYITTLYDYLHNKINNMFRYDIVIHFENNNPHDKILKYLGNLSNNIHSYRFLIMNFRDLISDIIWISKNEYILGTKIIGFQLLLSITTYFIGKIIAQKNKILQKNITESDTDCRNIAKDIQNNISGSDSLIKKIKELKYNVMNKEHYIEKLWVGYSINQNIITYILLIVITLHLDYLNIDKENKIMIFMLTTSMLSSIRRMVRNIQHIYNTKSKISVFNDLISKLTPRKICDIPFEKIPPTIKFKDINWNIKKKCNTDIETDIEKGLNNNFLVQLEELTVKINRGSCHLTALIGPIGSGKSTLISSLTYASKDVNGKIIVNNKEYDISILQKWIRLVNQKQTIYNVRGSNIEVLSGFDEKINVIKRQFLIDIIYKFANEFIGFKKIITKNNNFTKDIVNDFLDELYPRTKLSGGQTAIMNIIYNLYKTYVQEEKEFYNCKCLILDEIDSDLSSNDSYKFYNVLKNLNITNFNPAIIYVSHKPASWLLCDQFLIFKYFEKPELIKENWLNDVYINKFKEYLDKPYLLSYFIAKDRNLSELID
jgi:ABC-type lipoprotein export system ATPase subunit